MEAKSHHTGALFEKVEQYGRTSLELLKLKTVDKAADVSSLVISRLLLIVVVSLFTLTLNIAAALWLGDLLGKNYYGFLLVSSFYGFAGVVLFFIHPIIKTSINNSIVKQLLKDTLCEKPQQ